MPSSSPLTPRALAPAAFCYNFAAQLYGILASPSMKDIHDANLSFFSPQPYFIALFFFPQQILQVVWLWKLWNTGGGGKDDRQRGKGEEEEESMMLDYVPYYVLGNACIGTWMFAWTASSLILADVFVIINSAAQLWYTFFRLDAMNTRSTPSILTHAVVKTFTGIGVLDFLHNTSVAFFPDDLAPGVGTKVLTGLAFAGLGAVSDWILGASLVYDLVALSVGQASYSRDASWSGLLAGFAVGCVVIVGGKNYVR